MLRIKITSDLNRSEKEKIQRAARRVGLKPVRLRALDPAIRRNRHEIHQAARDLAVLTGISFEYEVIELPD